ncbi:unnamed protein product [Peniophora sp. CBMAI 1063]|nr:unnamed protein product [Peniophora sp. CBMAI 1063]
MPGLSFAALAALLPFAPSVCASSAYSTSQSPRVVLDNGHFVGVSQGAVSIYRGIPYAQPPVGDLRFRLPIANDPYNGTFNATAFGPACIQQPFNDSATSDLNPTAAGVLTGLLGSLTSPAIDDEDCLTVNVFAPANVTSESRLPVVFWIFGGGFQSGGTDSYNGSAIIERSLELEEPVVYVSVNYRLSALGFAGSAEVREAGIGNLALQDQRLALRWVQQYISAFGGDPSKVTIWGESAGAISIGMHMTTNNGDNEGLFRAAFMQSGGVWSTGYVEDSQPFFDDFATSTGCGNSLGSVAVFDCLRNASILDIRSALQQSRNLFGYSTLSLAWKPRADGVFLTDTPQRLVLNGSWADVPFVIGDVDDEGTLFALSNSNITTDDEVRQYLQQYFFPTANTSLLDDIFAGYPQDPSLGSPFDTGSNNTLTPENKRIAAILGDVLFQAPRRFLLAERPGSANAYAFLHKKSKASPVLGAYHTSDVSDIYAATDFTDALINFATNLDPNGKTLINWPVYTPDFPALFTFSNGSVTQSLTNDTFRVEGMQALIQASLVDPY